MQGCSHHTHTAGHTQVPETDSLVLGARGDHPASPCIQSQNVTCNNSKVKYLLTVLTCCVYKLCFCDLNDLVVFSVVVSMLGNNIENMVYWDLWKSCDYWLVKGIYYILRKELFRAYRCVHSGREVLVLSDSQWCRCCSLRPRHWSIWILHSQGPPWRPGPWWFHHACWTPDLVLNQSTNLGWRHRRLISGERWIILPQLSCLNLNGSAFLKHN